jgi:hypothetical protein
VVEKLAAGKPALHEVVPVGVIRFWPALEKLVPFQ